MGASSELVCSSAMNAIMVHGIIPENTKAWVKEMHYE